MDYNDSRPPRSRPPRPQSTQSRSMSQPPAPPPQIPNVTFQEPPRTRSIPDPRHQQGYNQPGQPPYSASYGNNPLPPTPNDGRDGEEGGFSDSGANFRRKKSLVRPDRERIDPTHRQWHYRTHAAQLETEGTGRVGTMPSTTGNLPQNASGGLRRGKSLLAREQDVQESGLALFKRGATLRRKKTQEENPMSPNAPTGPDAGKRGIFRNIAPGPIDAWMIYCWLLTIWIPPFVLRACRIVTPEQQRAWREKMGLLALIGILMAGVGFLTFGFQQTVCGKPPQRYHSGTIDKASVIIHGYDYDFSHFNHPAVSGVFTGTTNPLYSGGYDVAGMDISFLFQNVNEHCQGIIKAANGSTITNTNGQVGWYFPCNEYNQFGTSQFNKTGYSSSTQCHIKSGTRALFDKTVHASGQVYYTWDDLQNPQRNLAVFESTVLDFNLLNWLDRTQVTYPVLYDELKAPNGTFNGKDITMWVYRSGVRQQFQCLQDTVTVGFIDTITIGCVASDVVLYVSLVFIIGVVAIKFCMAVIFGWFLSWKLGAFKGESYQQRMARAAEIEQWTDDIYRPAPSRYRPNVPVTNASKEKRKTQFFPTTSRFSRADLMAKSPTSRPATTYGTTDANYRRTNVPSMYGGKTHSPSRLTPPDASSLFRGSRSSTSLEGSNGKPSNSDPNLASCPFPLRNVVPQPPPDFEPFNFPLAHTICLVTAYSESLEGLRTTLDSLATTDYPNSHKLIMVIADGMVKGSGNVLTTPEIVLSMMKELVVDKEDVEAHSYVAIADGHKRHNMAKVYAGFYDYDDNTVEPSKQQRVPIVLVAKCGNPLEISDPKPGNRGKRDSQIVLMAFLQKVMFDERMTTFEYEFFNSIWRVTGVSPDRYELVLCVDADTKVFPDSLTRMTACMVHDEEIMGLCGETKIANKAETWVTMIQVFEYYISHHLTKAFESMFGGVTCLPGCFSMYRIKVAKGDSGYWVPILANPDIVEHYSENIVDTLHKKNLLLLGEDRYLSTLMLKTFPKRKMIFCPQAVCKTMVPDTFGVLLSQRRRWINSTIHNLAELLFVRDLCGTFCFSMQFVVFMELTGTLVLPAAISFTIYLIIISIIQHGSKTLIPLILLGIILGLPGVLIVVTSRKIAYVGWMLAYLFALPVWNFMLPAYAFWHFDDFSWGQTRLVAGDKLGGEGDKDGEFDSSHIVMKRWAEFERERRWKSGTQSRDSMYDVVHRKGSPKLFESSRHSMGSTTETFYDQHSPGSSRQSQQPFLTSPSYIDSEGSSTLYSARSSAPLLMLPTPLAVSRSAHDTSPSQSSNEEIASYDPQETSSKRRLISSSPPPRYDLDDLPRPSPSATTPTTGSVLRQGTVSSVAAYPGETQNPYRHSQPQSASYEHTFPTFGEERDPSSPLSAPGRSRGVSLVDPGPVPTSDPVRRVARKRQSTNQPATTAPTERRYSRTSTAISPSTTHGPGSPSAGPASPSGSQNFSLPPGAAAPQPYPRF